MRHLRWFVVAFACAALAVAAPCGAEMRGAWVSAWTPGYLNAQQVDDTISAARKAGLNALFIQVRKNADAYYNSTLEPRSSDIAPGFDPLAYTIEKAHEAGMQVHAWVNMFRVWTAKDRPSDPNHIVNVHPDWLNVSFDGNTRASEGLYLDPGVPEAREHIASVAAEIASNYDIDGIQLDYIRYPGKQWGYSQRALSFYYSETGAATKPEPSDQRWLQWRRDQVTKTVKLIHDRVKSAGPKVVISAASVSWGDCPRDFAGSSSYSNVCQDWRAWLAEGLVDINAPMNYKNESNAKYARQFRNWLAGFKRWGSDRPVYVGIDVHNNSASGVVKQVEAIRQAGLDGFLLFSFNASSKRTALVEHLGRSVCDTIVSAPPSESGSPGSGSRQSREAFDRGIRYAMQNQVGMAIVHLKRAVELNPRYAEAHFRLGRCYLKERNLPKAREAFARTLEVDPSHEGAKTELAALER